eukprot:TRINITY_DN4891_c0_g1_i2.p3 TRINITY_DN4891_c0_g1~~TRINITY_DN4891_c0_g1_i2.p3  ORF type:complete len:229 (+),score=44.33 TRINITY_DN4891_c0_g1_i2:104-688(+)
MQDELRNFDLAEWGHVSIDNDRDDATYGDDTLWPPLRAKRRIGDELFVVGFAYATSLPSSVPPGVGGGEVGGGWGGAQRVGRGGRSGIRGPFSARPFVLPLFIALGGRRSLAPCERRCRLLLFSPVPRVGGPWALPQSPIAPLCAAVCRVAPQYIFLDGALARRRVARAVYSCRASSHRPPRPVRCCWPMKPLP